jgi:hypothetical protein
MTMPSYIKLSVTLRNADDTVAHVVGEGVDFEDAALNALDDHREETGDDTWEVVATGDYRTDR